MSSEPKGRWVQTIKASDLDTEDVKKWEFEGKFFAIYRSPEDEFYATDDICTHEHAHLSDGYIEDNVIECPRHAGRFCYKTGEALGAPVLVDLKTYPTRLGDDEIIEIQIS